MSFAKMKFFIAIILLAASAAVQSRGVQVHPMISMTDYRMGLDTRIIDGNDAQKGLLPWQAGLLLRLLFKTSLCGGSLINPKWVLTAAHCIPGVISIEVRMGGVNLLDGMEYTETSYKFFHHEDYIPQIYTNDIALVELPKPATLSVNLQIIPLPARSHPDLVGSSVRVSGYGKTLFGEYSETLKWVDLTVIDNTECAKMFPSLAPSSLCAYDASHRNPCTGDSGGPLVQYNLSAVQVGVVSFGWRGACPLGFPTAYARVTSFLDWINEHTGIPIRD